MSQPEKPGGNTRHRARRYQLTINNYEKSELSLLSQEFAGSKYIIGKEVGPENGHPHLHCYVEFDNQKDFDYLKKKFPRAHIEVCKGNRLSNIKYCMKDGDYENHGLPLPPKEYTYKDVIKGDLLDWQKKLETMINEEPHPDHIYWYWRKEGGSGKSTIGKYLYMKYPNVELTTATKSADILMCANVEKNVYILDFPRTCNDFSPYAALEQLKNGFVSDSKLKKTERKVCMPKPHVICFANFAPLSTHLSEYKLRCIELEGPPAAPPAGPPSGDAN